MRAIEHVHGDKAPHWVGDGFYVKTLINHLEASPDFNYTHTDPFYCLIMVSRRHLRPTQMLSRSHRVSVSIRIKALRP